MKIDKTIFLALMPALLLLQGCLGKKHGEPATGPESSPLVIYAGIANNASVLSKASTGTEDQKSYTNFETKDEMGFYSSGGNWLVGEGKGAFNNLQLQYDAELKQFNDRTNGVEFSPTQMDGSKIYMYYPYCAEMDDPGIVLRTSDDEVNPSPNVAPTRCIDFLSSYKIEISGVLDEKSMALFGEFDHAFAELIIMRGEGFNDPPEGQERITAVLDEGYTHLRVNIETESSWTVNPTLYYNRNQQALSEEDAKRWDAWRGKNYSMTVDDKVGQPAWYIIVPTIGSEVGKKRPGRRSIVQYIEICDNDGNWHQITSLRLSGGMTKYADAGWRYPMQISMKEMEPTVNPFPIKPWEPDVSLTDQRTRGINGIIEFAQWVEDYSNYLDSSDPEAHTTTLLKYGDLYIDDSGKKSWHFYLLADLDLTEIPPTMLEKNPSCILPALQDVLDGQSTDRVDGKYRNHTISGLDRTFVGKLSSADGKLCHIDFIKPNIKINSPSPTGILVNTIEGASVDNCNVYDGDLFNPDGPAGFVAGLMDGGTILNCTLSGLLISNSAGSGNWSKIVGTAPSGASHLEGNDASDVVTTPDPEP